MPVSQSPGTLKRPPLLSQASSSSLSGMEQAIPSFQSFLSRTPPPDAFKPLPPTPLIPRRASSASPPRSREPSLYSQRRSSSVYSRTVSQWFDDDSSWRSVDLRDDPMAEMPPLPILQPVAYSRSTPQLIERPAAPAPPALESRTYSPLIITPSPTASRVATPNRSPLPSPGPSLFRQQTRHQSQFSVPFSPVLHDGPQKQVHTVTLQQAKAAVHSPGAVHLLPEELRAQSLGKSRSHEPIRVPTLAFFDTASTPELPLSPTLVDSQGRHRSLQAQEVNLDRGSQYPFPTVSVPPVPSLQNIQQRRNPERERSPLETRHRQASQAKAAESSGLADEEEPRGRTRQRGPRSTDFSHYTPNVRRAPSSPSPVDEERDDAQKVASEYHSLLSEQYRQPSDSPAYSSDDSVRAHMKMVPQPLFKNKPAAAFPGSIAGRGGERGSNASEAPFHLRADSVASTASGTTQRSVPLTLSLTPESAHRRTSTTGSIPISPPMNVVSAPTGPTNSSSEFVKDTRMPSSRSRTKDERVSMYYPYVGPRKGKKAKEKKATEGAGVFLPPMPSLPQGTMMATPESPEASVASSPLQSTASVSTKANTSIRKDSNASSDRQRVPLFQRLADNAAKYADKITRPSNNPEGRNRQSQPSDSTTASQHSPHLLPSPVKSNPPPVHLGWSDSAKTTFDRSRSSMQSAPRTPQSTHFTHLPARPLDESRTGLRETESPAWKGSMFSGLLDGWKERKKEERREDLKKMIRVVPQGPPPQMRTFDIVPSPPPAPGQGLMRQASMGAGMPVTGGRPVSGGLGRRMSAFGWM